MSSRVKSTWLIPKACLTAKISQWENLICIILEYVVSQKNVTTESRDTKLSNDELFNSGSPKMLDTW